MAKAATKTKQVAQSDADTEIEVVDFSDALDAESLSPHLLRLQAELGVDADGTAFKVHVSKVTPEGKDARVWDGPPEDYDLMHIARQHGSGDYRVKLYGPHSSGRSVIRANEIMTVLLLPEEDLAIAERRNPAKQNGGAQFDPASFAATMAQTMAAALAPIVAHMQQPQRNPLDDLKGLAEVVKTIMPAQPAAPVGNAGFRDMLRDFQALKELTAPAVPVDGDGKVDAGGLALSKGIDVVGRMFDAHFNKPPQEHPALPAPHAAQPPNPNESQTGNEDMNMQLEMLKLQLRILNKKAANHANAREEAESLYDALPDDVLEMLGSNPQWWEFVTQILPDVAPHREWYDLLRLRVVEMAKEDNVLTVEGKLSTVGANDSGIDNNNAAGSGPVT